MRYGCSGILHTFVGHAKTSGGSGKAVFSSESILIPDRIFDMLVNLFALQTLGKCRELFVFGFVDEIPVYGIIVCLDLLLYSEFI